MRGVGEEGVWIFLQTFPCCFLSSKSLYEVGCIEDQSESHDYQNPLKNMTNLNHLHFFFFTNRIFTNEVNLHIHQAQISPYPLRIKGHLKNHMTSVPYTKEKWNYILTEVLAF